MDVDPLMGWEKHGIPTARGGQGTFQFDSSFGFHAILKNANTMTALFVLGSSCL
jgi:hypothetical protein